MKPSTQNGLSKQVCRFLYRTNDTYPNSRGASAAVAGFEMNYDVIFLRDHNTNGNHLDQKKILPEADPDIV